MDIGSIIRLLSWFVPIPFMLLYHVNTTKLNRLKNITLPITLILGCFSMGLGNIGFRVELRLFYILAICLSLLSFTKKYNFPQALSFAFCLTFFSSVFWEIPYHVFTTLQRGYLDQAFPLHLLYAFPAVFVCQKIKIKFDKRNVGLIFFSLLFSTIGMLYLLQIGADFFQTYKNPPILWLTAESIFMVSRIVCFTVVYIIFYDGQFRSLLIQKKVPK